MLQFRDDVYGYDSKLLSFDEWQRRRKVADIMIERPADPNYKPSPTDFARLDNVPRDGAYSGYGELARRGNDPFVASSAGSSANIHSI